MQYVQALSISEDLVNHLTMIFRMFTQRFYLLFDIEKANAGNRRFG